MAIKKQERNGAISYLVYVNKRDGQGRRYQRKQTARTMPEAKRLLAQLTLEVEQLISGKPNIEWEGFLRVYFETILSRQIKSFGTLSNEMHNFAKHVTPVWKGRVIREIAPSDITGILESAGLKDKSQQTKKHILCQIRSVFKLAIEKGFADRDPTQYLTIKVKKFNRVLPSSQDLRRMIAKAKALDLPMYPLIHFLILTGMRSGEAYALKWKNVDFDSGMVHVRENWTRRGGYKSFTKNGTHRQVPINGELRELLLQLRNTHFDGPESHVLPRLREWTNGEIGKSLRLFMQGLGMTPTTLHGLRAAFITEMLKSGKTIPVIMKIVGHSRLETSARYLALSGIELQDQTQCLNFLEDSLSDGRDGTSIEQGKSLFRSIR